MTGFVFLDSDQARQGARALFNLAVDLENNVSGPAAALEAFNNSKAWSADPAGSEFYKNYGKMIPLGESGSVPAHTAGYQAVRQYAELLKRTAGNIIISVGVMNDTDQAIADWLKANPLPEE